MASGPFSELKFAVAISVTYQAADRTLTDQEVDDFDKRILANLRKRLGAELRQ